MANPTKLWVDDWRPAPEGWANARTYDEADHLLFGSGLLWDEIALDSDLGDLRPEHQGFYLLRRLVDREMEGGPLVPKITILTSSPVARKDMETSLRVLHEWREGMR